MDIGDCKANGRVTHRRRTWGTMAHKAIRLFRNICSHTRPLDASISMFRPSKRKSGENAAGWGEFCEGWGPKSENGQSRIVNFGISPVESAEIAKIYDISLEKVWRRVCENTYNNYFFLCRCKKKKKGYLYLFRCHFLRLRWLLVPIVWIVQLYHGRCSIMCAWKSRKKNLINNAMCKSVIKGIIEKAYICKGTRRGSTCNWKNLNTLLKFISGLCNDYCQTCSVATGYPPPSLWARVGSVHVMPRATNEGNGINAIA